MTNRSGERVSEARAEIGSLRPPMERMADDVTQATAMLPDLDPDGPLTRLRDAVTPG